MTRLICILLTLLISLSGSAMGEYSDFGRWSNAAKGGMTLADDMAVLRQATTGKGNFGVGAAGADDAARLGRSWVGEGAEWSSSGKALVSPDGLRQFRPPSLKPNSPYATTGSQANFEWRNVPSGQWQGNGHLNITPP
jgi:hypothetical protein